VTGHFTEPQYHSIDPSQFGVVLSGGLAITPDEAVKAMTGGVMDTPAATLVLGVVSRDGEKTHQLLISVATAAALEGSLRGWSGLLPVDARDQYDALRQDSQAKYDTIAREYLGGDR
jgi:hypothetical protein